MRTINEDSWPHGTKRRVVTEEVDVEKLAQYVALAAKNVGLLDVEDPVKATREALKQLVQSPAALTMAIKKISKQPGTAAKTVRQIRKDMG
jgi:hypothetical protein